MIRARVYLLAAVGTVIGACLLGFAGCNADQYGTYKVNPKHYTIDGKSYRCLLIRTDKGTASLSCDWDHPLP